MIITLKRQDGERQTPTITIDTKDCVYVYALIEAFELALRLEGHDKKTIDMVFGRIYNGQCETSISNGKCGIPIAQPDKTPSDYGTAPLNHKNHE